MEALVTGSALVPLRRRTGRARLALRWLAAICIAAALTVPASAQEKGAAFPGRFASVEGVVIRPLGEIGKLFESGAGGYAGYGIPFDEKYVLMLQAGYTSYSSEGAEEPGGEELSAVHFIGGPRWYPHLGVVSPFLGIQIGVNIVDEAISTPELSKARTSVQFAWQMGAGLTVPFGGQFGAEFQAKYNSHFLHHEAMMTGFEYGISLLYFIDWAS